MHPFVCLHVCRIRKNQHTICQTLFYAYGNNFLKDIPKKITAVETAASVLGSRRFFDAGISFGGYYVQE